MNEDRLKELEQLLGKKPRAADLARYLGVARATVSGYPEKKRELMLLGLWVKKYLEEEEMSNIKNIRKWISGMYDISQVVKAVNDAAQFAPEEVAAAYALLGAEENGYPHDLDNIEAQLEALLDAGAEFDFLKARDIAAAEIKQPSHG